MSAKNKNGWHISPSTFFGRFIIIFMVIGVLLASAITVIYHLESRHYLQRIMLDEKHSLSLQKEIITKKFESIFADLLFLSKQNELIRFLDENDPAIKKSLEIEYLKFCRYKAIYDQIRFINEAGMEIARINYHSGTPEMVKARELQLKKHRYYFEDTILLNRGQIFVSPLDLNMEMGKIEYPIKPMIRFGTPVYDSQGNKRGVVILNFLAGNLIAEIKNVSEVATGRAMLLNQQGFWLSGPNPDDEWGFMYPNKADKRFDGRYPEAWRHIFNLDSTQLINSNGIFTSETIYPLTNATPSKIGPEADNGKNIENSVTPVYYWKLISYISNSTRQSITRGLFFKLLIMGSVLILIGSLPSYLIAKAIAKQQLTEMELNYMANYDPLTGLPNRTLFMDRLKQMISQSHRYDESCALLFVDLSGFKSVNNTLGHRGGDELLVQTAQRLISIVRGPDTVARLAGDEFAVILSIIKESNNAELVARKIIKELSKPFQINGATISVGASIGISLPIEATDNADTLIKKADKAMHLAKKQGGNNCARHDGMGVVFCFADEGQSG